MEKLGYYHWVCCVFLAIYIALTEFNKGAMQKGEIVLFLRGSLKKHKEKQLLLTREILKLVLFLGNLIIKMKLKLLVMKSLQKRAALEVLISQKIEKYFSGKI